MDRGVAACFHPFRVISLHLISPLKYNQLFRLRDSIPSPSRVRHSHLILGAKYLLFRIPSECVWANQHMVVVVDFAVVVVFLILACQLLLIFKCFLIISNMITAMEPFSSHFHTNFILIMFFYL